MKYASSPSSLDTRAYPALLNRLPVSARSVLFTTAITAAAAATLSCAGVHVNSPAEQAALTAQGQQIFRFDTFGDEAQWTDAWKINEVISAAVDPVTALSVGLKVDAEALPAAVVQGIQNGTIDLKSPATTIALLKLNAVVGLKGTVENIAGKDVLTRVGITCALCHSTVDNSFAPGIGKRLDGWANRSLNPGAIIALSPTWDAATKAALNAWGPGKFDPRHNVDGISRPVVIPPAFGMEGLHRVTFTGDGTDVSYWNRYVAVAEMGGLGSFSEPRLNVNITHGTKDLVTSKLPALKAYELSLKAPAAPANSFDAAAAARGKQVFSGPGKCATCHSGAEFTDANARLHPPSDSVAEAEQPSYASRSATKQYRTSPLRGVWQHAPYFHNGSAATLQDVVAKYDRVRELKLTAEQQADLTQYLKSL